MNLKIAALVVTFNRKTLLEECLEALRAQTQKVDAIYIIDNSSSDGTPELLKEKLYLPYLPNPGEKENIESQVPSLQNPKDTIDIKYVRLIENEGCSGGLNEGIKQVYEAGFDLIWIMDDDVKPLSNTLKNMYSNFIKLNTSHNNVVCIVPARKYIDGELVKGHEQIHNTKLISKTLFKKRSSQYIDKMTFEGPLIKTVECFESKNNLTDYFILYDDVDMAAKLTKIGKIFFDEDSTMIKQIKIPNNFYVAGNEWKQYYRYRNMLFFVKNNFKIQFLIPTIYIFSTEIYKLRFKVKNKTYTNVFKTAVFDFFRNRTGRSFTPQDNPWLN